MWALVVVHCNSFLLTYIFTLTGAVYATQRRFGNFFFCPLSTCHVKRKTAKGLAGHCKSRHPPTLDRVGSVKIKDGDFCVEERPSHILRALPYKRNARKNGSRALEVDTEMDLASDFMQMDMECDEEEE